MKQDKSFKKVFLFALGLGLIGVVLPAAGKQAQMAPNEQAQFTLLIHSVEGPGLFRAYCAPCHGTDAKGGGPAAHALKANMPDLTSLARKNRGRFPEACVRQTIMGDENVAAHGSRQMPVWGPIFHQVEVDRDWGNVRLVNLVKYLQSIQAIATPDHPPSGAELYKEHCAACHGDDLKGGGHTPEPYRAPPDLTTLARRHRDEFPDAYVANVLRNGVVMPAHGPAEMPIWGADFTMDKLGELEVST